MTNANGSTRDDDEALGAGEGSGEAAATPETESPEARIAYL